MPRPLPAHLASAMLLWLSSRAALPSLASGSPSWSAALPADDRLAALAKEIGRRGGEPVAAALDRELARRAGAFLSGLEAYRRHSFRRPALRVPVRWRQGSARLIDYGPRQGGGTAVLIVPSLINRWTILDLLPERSYVRHLAKAGLRPLVLDWGEPSDSERGFGLDDYITAPLAGALEAVAAFTGGPVALAGYCMGGLLALAAALRAPELVKALVLLATPWDFHAERAEQSRFLASLVEFLPALLGEREKLPVAVIQALFMTLDPFLAERKFVHFAGLDVAGEAARGFVALEDWINDGVTLAMPVALDCARAWYRDNEPATGRWQVGGEAVLPQRVAMPTLVVLPSRDRIVPPASAAPLAAAISAAQVLRPPFGHIGMMASAQAPQAVWQPIAAWLRETLV